MAALDCAFELSKLLDCGLDKEALSICVALIENGVNPEALAEVVQQLRAKAAGAAAEAAGEAGGAAASGGGIPTGH
ncbi:hypothetical protein ABPG77_010976 [Micractinium sp. CCAP 211/92]